MKQEAELQGVSCAAGGLSWAGGSHGVASSLGEQKLEGVKLPSLPALPLWSHSSGLAGVFAPTREDEGMAYRFLTENQFNRLGVFQRPIHSLDKYFSNASFCQVRAWGFRGEPLLTLFLPPSEKKEC